MAVVALEFMTIVNLQAGVPVKLAVKSVLLTSGAETGVTPSAW
jgi:hypothetical protein